jgi:hypothetical protein
MEKKIKSTKVKSSNKKLNISSVINFNYCKDCTNDYDDPQMCKFCKNGSHQTLTQ